MEGKGRGWRRERGREREREREREGVLSGKRTYQLIERIVFILLLRLKRLHNPFSLLCSSLPHTHTHKHTHTHTHVHTYIIHVRLTSTLSRDPGLFLSQPISLTRTTHLDTALVALVDELMQRVPASFAYMPSPCAHPAHVVAPMIRLETLCDTLDRGNGGYCCSSIIGGETVKASDLRAGRVSWILWGGGYLRWFAVEDLLGTRKQTEFIPLNAEAGFPTGTADIAV